MESLQLSPDLILMVHIYVAFVHCVSTFQLPIGHSSHLLFARLRPVLGPLWGLEPSLLQLRTYNHKHRKDPAIARYRSQDLTALRLHVPKPLYAVRERSIIPDKLRGSGTSSMCVLGTLTASCGTLIRHRRMYDCKNGPSNTTSVRTVFYS